MREKLGVSWNIDLRIYLALDGTKDVTQASRCATAALLGQFALVCALPVGADPDDLSGEELSAVKAEARPVLTEWLELAGHAQGPDKAGILEELGRLLVAWSAASPAMAGDLRAESCAALGLQESEYERWLHGCGASTKLAAGRAADDRARRAAGPGGGAAAQSGRAGGSDPLGGASASAVVGEAGGDLGGGGEGTGGAFPGQPEPLGRATGSARREISNFYREYRLVADEKLVAAIAGDAGKIRELKELKELDAQRLVIKRAAAEYMKAKEAGAPVGECPVMEAGAAARLDGLRTVWKCAEKGVVVAKHTDALRAQIADVMRGWPMRLVSGSLFVDDDRALQKRSAGALTSETSLSAQFGPPVRMIDDSTRFLSLLHDYATVKFNKGQDVDRCNYVDGGTLFSNVCSAPDVRLWLEIERYPHQPALPGHYYAWRPLDDGYVPTGEKLSELIGFFDNIVEPHHRALFAAAIVTVFWGGRYGKRPFLFFWANMQGSGKSTAAEVICELVGGYAAVNFTNRDEERLKERILSDEFSGTRCLLADNVVGRVASPLLAELATASRISGKKLAVGEAWRPNSLCVFLTGNNPQLVKDLTSRTFFVKFEPIEGSGEVIGKDVGERTAWDKALRAFIAENAYRIMSDCLAILKAPKPEIDWTGVTAERNADWAAEVLAAVLANPACKSRIGETTAKDVLIRNQAYRESVDEELDEATRFMQALIEAVCEWGGYGLQGDLLASVGDLWPKEERIFIRASPKRKKGGDDEDDDSKQNITSVWRSAIRGDVNPTWVGRHVNMHIEAGRMKGLTPYRNQVMRGYEIESEMVVRFLAVRARRDPDAVVVEWQNFLKALTSTAAGMTA